MKRTTERIRRQPQWLREILYCLVCYAGYSFVRNVHGSVLSVHTATAHAASVVKLERALGIFHERAVQEWFLPHTVTTRLFDVYYGTLHFVVTIAVLLWLYHVEKNRYHRWRNVLFASTALALVGYMAYPLAPPRLLPSSYGFVDTMNTIGGLWTFQSRTVEQVSNQYAAMPSLHMIWALWCAFALMTTLRHWWAKALIAFYPLFTAITVVVTANHFWVDIFGGVIAFALGHVVGTKIDRRFHARFVLRQFRAREIRPPEARAPASKAPVKNPLVDSGAHFTGPIRRYDAPG